MKAKKTLAALLAVAMLGGVMAGCAGDNGNSSSSKSSGESGSSSTSSGDVATTSTGTIILGNTDFNEKLTPFFATTANDNDLQALVCETLISNDRQGAPADNISKYMEPEIIGEGDARQTVYTFTIQDNVKFSDGSDPTTEDLLFALKVFCDPAYDGSATFYSLPIVGMNEWRYNNSKISEVSDDNVRASMAAPDDDMKAAIVEKVITPLFASELEWVRSLDDATFETYSGAAAADYPETKDRFAAFYAADKNYDSKAVADEAQVLADVVAQYNGDFKAAAAAYGDESYLDAQAFDAVKAVLASRIEGGEPVDEISGVELVDAKTIKITLNGVNPKAIWDLGGLPVIPRNHYGAETYTRGDLSMVKAQNMNPVGTGPYKFVSFENGVVSFEANETYWQGAPKTAKIKYQVINDAAKLSSVQNGEIDIADPQAGLDNIQAVEDAGLHKELIDYLGYGYMAINAELVPDINVRKGILTLVSGYRKSAIQTAYGETANVLERPMSQVSWAYPEGATEYYAGGKEKALEYFKAAGYEQDASGKLMKDGKQLSFTVTGGSLGSHPISPALNQAKADMESLGGEWIINDVDPSILFEAMDGGTLQGWVAAWSATIDPDMYQVYYSTSAGNKYKVKDSELDQYIVEGISTLNQDERKVAYEKALDRVMELAVELPLYQRSDMYIYNPEHVDITSLPEDMTPYYTHKQTWHTLAAK